MKTLYDKTALQEILQRLDKLTPDTQRQWGTMDAAQMLAHCNLAVESASGLKSYPRSLMGKLIGGFFKKEYLSPKPFPKNSPTNPSFVMKDKKDFQAEKDRLVKLLKQFSEGGPEKASKNPHSFFGRFTGEEWGKTQYKHMDHHLRQFGV